MTWMGWLVVGLATLVASWCILIILVRRLPDGLLKELAGFLPACVSTIGVLRKNPQVPRRAKLAIAFAGLWVLSPIDLIPEFVPIIGPLDDVIVVALAFRYAARQVPRSVLTAAWTGNPDTLERLIGADSAEA
ncbi:MAG TPA: DUF1232 domain-containing protein [Acidimicrobiales bacterium]|nr:DUF1232 domain-containing protein [Acidimicrobiales bacterium]